MSRVITKPSDVRPVNVVRFDHSATHLDVEVMLPLPECKKISKTYGELCRLSAKVRVIVRDAEQGSKSRRRYYRLFLRIIRAIDAWESLFNSPEWGGKDV